jgi:predicted metalloprotease with PDZ domain
MWQIGISAGRWHTRPFPVYRASLFFLATAVWSPLGCDPPTERAVEGLRPRLDRPAPARAGRAGPAPSGPALTDGGSGVIAHRLSFPEARNHYVEIESVFPTAGRADLDLMMAVWTPGSYLVREYSRHVEALAAFGPDGARLPATKTRKNRWRVTTGGADPVTIRYRLYAAEVSVRTNWVSGDLAVLNGAATFLAPVGDLGRPHDVALVPPAEWPESVTPLPPHPGGQPHRYLARDYDALVDSPILLGRPIVRRFDVAGVRHRLVHVGDTGLWDIDRAARDVARLVDVQRAFWGDLPYRTYDFLSVLLEAGSDGGLEHLESTLLLSSPWTMRRKRDYAGWLGTVSHELFHAWNVKRLRPIELGPFDYENEVYTESLWVAEGLTRYYQPLMVLRAGLMDQEQYLAVLSERIGDVETGPGRAVQSLARSSFDAWIEYYRPDENSANSTVDYYEKGSVVGFLLDAEIRRATAGRRSLDDVMRLAYRRYSGARGYRPEEMRQVAEEIAGRDLGQFWRDHIDGVAALDYRPALDYFGLRFAPGKVGKDGACAGGAKSDAAGGEPPGHLGLDARANGGKLLVTRVVRDGPAWAAGLQAGDEIVAIDDRRVEPDGLAAALSRLRPGARVTVLVSRWDVLHRLPVVLGREPEARFCLQVASDATSAQRSRLAAWLAPPR